MSLKTKPFDVTEHLATQEDIKIFLQYAADGTPEEFIHALNTVSRAMGMTEVAKKAGVTRASLWPMEVNPSLLLSVRSARH